jgi:hypothetical protein
MTPGTEDLRIDLDSNTSEKNLLIDSTDDIVIDTSADADEKMHTVPESLGISDGDLDDKTIEMFYRTVSDDLEIIHQQISEWGNGDAQTKDISKIKLSMRIMITHPLLKQLEQVKQLFTQVQKGISLLETNFSHFSGAEVVQNAKEMLKYIEKENILKNKDLLLEQINEIGIKQHKLRSQIARKSRVGTNKMDSVREKIAKKNLIKDVSLLDSMQKNNRD